MHVLAGTTMSHWLVVCVPTMGPGRTVPLASTYVIWLPRRMTWPAEPYSPR